VFRLDEAKLLGRLTPLVGRPGLAAALARTVAEARALSLSPVRLEPALAAAMTMFDDALEEARLVDHAAVFELAREAVRPTHAPLVLLDVSPQPGVEESFVTALVRATADVVATAPRADEAAVRSLSSTLGVAPQHLVDPARSPLRALQHNLFTSEREDATHQLADLFSAPGEARECVEIARRALELGASGMPFDRMAVVLRAPSVYRAPLEEAFRRAEIPAHFTSGIPIPDPSGRALLALLHCAEERLSARRFSEYLSLAQVPPADATGAPPPARSAEERYERPLGETLLPSADDVLAPAEEPEIEAEVEGPVQSGQLRAPRKWERLIIDAAVIGGVDRWRRRLAGLRNTKLAELESPALSDAQRQRVERQLGDLEALSAFALPLLELLAGLPRRAKWGEWLERLGALASRALKEPRRVLAILHELGPMSIVGPVELAEVRSVLAPRLSELTDAPGTRRYGCIFVTPVSEVLGLDFDVVFVPGLAERLFPQKVREDPLLSDAARASVDGRLDTNAARIARERLALQVAVGAARVRAVLSWPRIDVEHGRPRVPSFYALEAAQAVEGALPGYEALQRRAELEGHARLAWPAPEAAARAIDATEYDLSVLADLFRAKSGGVRGRARYLLEVNPALRRSLRARYARWTQSRLTFADGLVAPSAQARQALEAHQLSARPFSPTALEQFAACPYRFFLSAIQRLAPLEIPGEVEELGPLEKGSMTHEVLYVLQSQLRDAGVPVSAATLTDVFKRLDAVIDQVTAKFADDFVPAIEQVWKDGIALLRADLREWLRRVADDAGWAPWRFELGFGLQPREQQDPSSVTTPVPLVHGLQLRGSIDLVELSAKGTLRATDYKTGRARAKPGNVVGGGRHLQPALYALVLEQLLPGHPVEAGRLSYLTQLGGFTNVSTPLDARAREAMGQVILTIRTALEQGFFPALPADGECRWCDYSPVCGPDEERRARQTKKTIRKEVEPLMALRRLP
jgi:RecB family exonuclease